MTLRVSNEGIASLNRWQETAGHDAIDLLVATVTGINIAKYHPEYALALASSLGLDQNDSSTADEFVRNVPIEGILHPVEE